MGNPVIAGWATWLLWRFLVPVFLKKQEKIWSEAHELMRSSHNNLKSNLSSPLGKSVAESLSTNLLSPHRLSFIYNGAVAWLKWPVNITGSLLSTNVSIQKIKQCTCWLIEWIIFLPGNQFRWLNKFECVCLERLIHCSNRQYILSALWTWGLSACGPGSSFSSSR